MWWGLPLHLRIGTHRKIWKYLCKLERNNLFLLGEDLLINTIHLPWFIIQIILIPLNLHIGMNSIPLSTICILVHNYYNCASMWMSQTTNIRNGNWSNLMIINSSNVGMPVWGRIDNSSIITIDPYIRNPVNQWLAMCEVVGGNIDKCSVNPTIQFSINIDLFYPLCIT